MRLEQEVGSGQAGCGGPASTEPHRPGFYREEQCESIGTFKGYSGYWLLRRLDGSQSGERTLSAGG